MKATKINATFDGSIREVTVGSSIRVVTARAVFVAAMAFAIAVLLAAQPASASQGFENPSWVVGPIQDFRGDVGEPTLQLPVPTVMRVSHIVRDGDGRVITAFFTEIRDIEWVTVRDVSAVSIGGFGYIESPTPYFNEMLRVTTIYGVDRDKNAADLMLTGLDPLSPQFTLDAPETLFGISGNIYTADQAFLISIGELSSLLGDQFDLSPFAMGDPNSFVYVFQTNIPSWDALLPTPEPNSLVLLGSGLAGLARLLKRKLVV